MIPSVILKKKLEYFLLDKNACQAFKTGNKP